jgi:hypothetical protein
VTQPGSDAAPFSLPDGGGPADGQAPGQSCAAEVFRAEPVPVGLMLLVDSSGSMSYPAGALTKWQRARDALVGFVKDARSAGLSVGLQFFPNPNRGVCTSNADCGGIFNPCEPWGACTASSGTVPPGAPHCSTSDPQLTCPGGTTCRTLGRCAGSGAPCTNVGEACAEAGAGACTLLPLMCRDPATSCAVSDYERPAVAIADLPGVEGALTTALEGRKTDGATPLGPAVEGALTHLRAHLASHPGRRGALVLATDGLPEGCATNETLSIARKLTQARMEASSITTYVVGVFAELELLPAQMELGRLAQAGGSGSPFLLTATEDLTERLRRALDQIRGAALPCEYTIPRPRMGQLDYAKVNVRFSGGADTEDLYYVGSADRCDTARGGWYYDLDPATGATPTRVLMCEASCRRLKAETSGEVELRFGCKTRYIP